MLDIRISPCSALILKDFSRRLTKQNNISGESIMSIVSDEASMTGHWGRSGRCGTAVVSSRRERRKAVKRVQRTFNNAAQFWMLKSIRLWIPNEKPIVDARKSYKTAFAM